MKVVILAGGRGTRLGEETVNIPKPMVQIGQQPILWHIMKIYSQAGFNEFVILLGYKGEIIKDYFSNYLIRRSSFSIDLRNGRIDIHDHNSEPWKITLVDTGLDTMTGGRIRQAERFTEGAPFLLTYGDGVADVDIRKLVEFHKSKGGILTLTAVQPEGRFGMVEIEPDQKVKRMEEKPLGDKFWYNGGFFVCEPEIYSIIGEQTDAVFEREPMEQLALSGRMFAYKHPGFWRCMDTLRDKVELNQLWDSDLARWSTW